MRRTGNVGRGLFALAATLIAAVLLAACGGDSDSTSGSSVDLTDYDPGEETVTGVDQDTYGKPDPAGDYTIGVTFPHFKDEYWIAEAYGVQQEADELGIDVEIQAANGYGDTATQLDQLENFRVQGVDAVIVGAVDSKGIAPTVDTLWNEGIPVVYANALAESERIMGVFTDDELAGRAQAAFIAEQDPDAKVVAMCGPPGVIWPKLRCEAFADELSKQAPDAEIVAEKYHDMDRAVIADLASTTLQGAQDANWVYNSTDLQAKGVVDALRAQGDKPGDIGVTNLTTGRELWDMFEEGWISYSLAERPVLQGRLAVDQAVMVLNGETPPARWAVDLPGFENTPEEITRFQDDEAQNNWSPEDFNP